MELYVLTVEEGEYSDFGCDILGVFDDLDKAKSFAQTNQLEYRNERHEHFVKYDSYEYYMSFIPITLEWVGIHAISENNAQRRYYLIEAFNLNGDKNE